MREIEFRGITKDTKEWVYGCLITLPFGKSYILFDNYDNMVEVNKETVGQYMGLKDKNGTKIYEGDILSFDGNMTADNSLGFEPNGYIYDENSIHYVVWNNKMSGFEPNFEDEENKYKFHTRQLMITGQCEVIGNIYQDSHLMKRAS
jgi:uncharacterized phage protein (TIGR01671 family)